MDGRGEETLTMPGRKNGKEKSMHKEERGWWRRTSCKISRMFPPTCLFFSMATDIFFFGAFSRLLGPLLLQPCAAFASLFLSLTLSLSKTTTTILLLVLCWNYQDEENQEVQLEFGLGVAKKEAKRTAVPITTKEKSGRDRAREMAIVGREWKHQQALLLLLVRTQDSAKNAFCGRRRGTTSAEEEEEDSICHRRKHLKTSVLEKERERVGDFLCCCFFGRPYLLLVLKPDFRS